MIGFLLWLAGLARGGIEPVPPPEGAEQALSRRVALVVGIDEYQSREIGGLRFAAEDARDVAEVLGEEGLGGFEVHRLDQGRLDREAFWAAFAQASQGLRRGDVFVLYFAGHGSLELLGKRTRLYLLPSDADLADLEGSAIALDELEGRLAGLAVQHRVLIVDACHSLDGRGRSQVSERARVQLRAGGVPPALDIAPGRAELRLFAAELGQPAQEDPELRNGVYTHFLVEGLRGAADKDGDGRIEVREAHSWAAAKTRARTGDTQWPLIEGEESGPIYLAGRPPEPEAGYRPGPSVPTRGAGEGGPLGLRLGGGGAWTKDAAGEITTPWALRQELGWSLSPRWHLGLGAAQSLGEALAPGMRHIGAADLRAGWAAGGDLRVGPELGPGLRWRISRGQPAEIGAYFLAGARVQWSPAGWYLALSPQVELALTDDERGFRLLPGLPLSVGWEF